MGAMKSLYLEFLDKAGIDPEDDQARFVVEKGDLNKAFHDFVEDYLSTNKTPADVRFHKTDKIQNINTEEGEWE